VNTLYLFPEITPSLYPSSITISPDDTPVGAIISIDTAGNIDLYKFKNTAISPASTSKLISLLLFRIPPT